MDTFISWLAVGVLVGMLYAPLTLGLAWAFRIMNYPDLTCEGTFMFSGAVSIVVLNSSNSLMLAVFCGIISAAIAGFFTAFLNVYLKISRLLSGIITWSILYSVTIRVLGGFSELHATKPTIFTAINKSSSANVELGIALTATFLITLITIVTAKSRWGRITRAFGDQPWFSVGLGFSSKKLTILGLIGANILIGMSGILLCHFRELCDVNMSMGVLISGLAALVIGEAIYDAKGISGYIVILVIGTIIYNLSIGAFYFNWKIGLEKIFFPSDVRLFTGLMLLIPSAIIARKLRRYRLFASEW